MTKGVSLVVEIDPNGLSKGHRYTVTLGDGSRSSTFLLASRHDQFSDQKWTFLLGDPQTRAHWQTDTRQIYVSVNRQYPNPNFDFEPKSYEHYGWLIASLEVSQFRLYNPFIGWPTLDWPKGNTWSGGSINYGQEEQHQFGYTIDEYGFKYNEKDVQYYVRRNSDTDDYKEFYLRLSV